MDDLRNLRALSQHFRAYPVSRIGVAGSLIAAIGAFCPLDIAGHHVTYFARGHGDGQIVVGAAFIGFMAAALRVRLVTALMGAVILGMLYSLYHHELLAVMRTHDLGDDGGLYVMGLGAVLMLVSPIFRRSIATSR